MAAVSAIAGDTGADGGCIEDCPILQLGSECGRIVRSKQETRRVSRVGTTAAHCLLASSSDGNGTFPTANHRGIRTFSPKTDTGSYAIRDLVRAFAQSAVCSLLQQSVQVPIACSAYRIVWSTRILVLETLVDGNIGIRTERSSAAQVSLGDRGTLLLMLIGAVFSAARPHPNDVPFSNPVDANLRRLPAEILVPSRSASCPIAARPIHLSWTILPSPSGSFVTAQGHGCSGSLRIIPVSVTVWMETQTWAWKADRPPDDVGDTFALAVHLSVPGLWSDCTSWYLLQLAGSQGGLHEGTLEAAIDDRNRVHAFGPP